MYYDINETNLIRKNKIKINTKNFIKIKIYYF